MRCANPAAAVDWLCDAFGFERHLVVDDGSGGVVHAQLTLGNCMVMLGPIGDNEYDQFIGQPNEAGGKVTQAPYIVIDNPEEHCAHAKANGADIVYGPKDDDGRGVMYSCRDPDGHLWNFGSYNPWTDNDQFANE